MQVHSARAPRSSKFFSISCALALAALAACASTPAPAPDAAADPAASVPDPTLPDGHARLSRDAVPTRYRLDLEIDPVAGAVRGVVSIDVVLAEPLQVVLMHAEDLTIASATASRGGTTVPLAAKSGDNGALALIAPAPLVAGEHRLRITYSGAIPETPVGLYRVQENERWYAFTQFEPLEARRAFPCFDQPEFKTPFETHITVPKGMIAATNGPEVARAETDAGVAFAFAPTQPLPTYLVAFVVGDLDVVDAAPDAAAMPIRVLTTKGKGRLAAFAIDRTAASVTWLSDWFGIPYPFAKLDSVAVPNFSAGAMENAGLITYRDALLLVEGATAPMNVRRRSESVIAHELAHMWFGDYATLAWWDDLWLNEAFATWMANKAVHALSPEIRMPERVVQWNQWAMSVDAKAAARAIRQPITSGGDIYNAFDGITYTKGQAVLAMLERWLGPDAFQAGVRAYMKDHAYGTAVTADLLSALDAASGKPVSDVVARFLDQPGTPLVDVRVACERDRKAPAVLTLSQRRWRQLESKAPEMPPWKIPVCLRYQVGRDLAHECVLLEGESMTHTLTRPGCPTWIVPNDQQSGYYRWTLEPKYLTALTARAWPTLDPREQVAFPGEMSALLATGAITVDDYLGALLPLTRRDLPPLALEAVLDGIVGLRRLATTPAARARHAALVTKTLRRLLRGTDVSEAVPLEERELRGSLIASLVLVGNDPKLAAKAREVTDAFLTAVEAGPDAPRPAQGMVGLYVPLAAASPVGVDSEARQGLHARMTVALAKAADPFERQTIVSALAAFPEPALITRSLAMLTDGTLLAQDFRSFRRGADDEERLAAMWTWMQAHFDPLVERLGTKAAPHLPSVTAAFCDDARAAEVKAFFDAKASGIPTGLARNLAQALEAIEGCAALRRAHGDAYEAWLDRNKR